MQEAIPYRTYFNAGSGTGRASPAHDGGINDIQKTVLENAVVVFGRRGCCMCHVVKTLLLGHGVNPVVFEVNEGDDEAMVFEELSSFNGVKDGENVQFPAVFVGGKLFGGLDQVMAAHISGELVPILKDAGALWL